MLYTAVYMDYSRYVFTVLQTRDARHAQKQILGVHIAGTEKKEKKHTGTI